MEVSKQLSNVISNTYTHTPYIYMQYKPIDQSYVCMQEEAEGEG